MTSIAPGAREFVQKFGPLLTQLGATKVEAPTPFDIRLTYTNNSQAVTAQAAFNDSVWGSRLIVANESVSEDLRIPTSAGLADLVSQVPQTSAHVGSSTPKQIRITTGDPQAYEGLKYLLRPQPTLADGPAEVSVSLAFRPPPALPA